MYDHYDMEQSVSLDKYNEALYEIEDLKNNLREMTEEKEYYKTKNDSLNEIIKNLYEELKRADVQNIQEN